MLLARFPATKPDRMNIVSICFVIQPFDAGKFDKRYEDVLKPAIEEAGLVAYRVDRDVGVEVPIDAIEEGIRSSTICLAEITTDNPNVWYELGYARARGRPVVMISSKERAKFPFDIQHRAVISYESDSTSDFTGLRASITAKIKALLLKGERIDEIAESTQVSDIEGLSPTEIVFAACLAANLTEPGSHAGLNFVRQDCEKAGLTAVGCNLALRRLIKKGFVETEERVEDYDRVWHAVSLTSKGWDWIDSNESKFVLRHEKKAKARNAQRPADTFEDDDIPF